MQESAESEGSECDAALSCELVFTTRLPSVLPFPVGRKREFVPVQAGKKPAATAITTAAWSAQKQRLYAGLSNGDVCFWPLGRDGAQQLKYVGSHKGPVTCLCLPKRGDGELGASGLLLSGSVDGNIKIWDYLGKVGSEPTVCVQTLYGHSRTITGLFTYGDYILSSSTDKTVKVWRAVPGREQLVYPWYNLQVRHAPPRHTGPPPPLPGPRAEPCMVLRCRHYVSGGAGVRAGADAARCRSMQREVGVPRPCPCCAGDGRDAHRVGALHVLRPLQGGGRPGQLLCRRRGRRRGAHRAAQRARPRRQVRAAREHSQPCGHLGGVLVKPPPC